MDHRIHFISGLPRSGSTLLAALLAQNPLLATGMASPLAGILSRMLGGMGSRAEFAGDLTDERRRAMLRAVVAAYYGGVAAPRVAFDTNRAWCSRLPLVAALFPDAKVIVCVRDLVEIMESFERLVGENALLQSALFRPAEPPTAYARAEALTAPQGVVGFAWLATEEAFYGPHAHRLIVVDYEALAREPARVLERLYAALGLTPFAHDFDDVRFEAGAGFDAGFGLRGLHAVRPQVSSVTRRARLPPDLVRRFAGRSFWRRPRHDSEGAALILPHGGSS